MNQAAGGDYEYVYDRSTRREKRPEKEIGISAVRGGTIVGDHDVIFAGQDESYYLFSYGIFQKCSQQAQFPRQGSWQVRPSQVMYDMSRVIEGK